MGHIFTQSAANAGVGIGVASAGGVVKHQHLGALEQGTRYAQSLLLTSRDVGTTLLYHGVIAIRHLLDKLIGTRHTASLLALLERSVALAPSQVVEHGASKEHILLQHHRHIVAQHLQVVVTHIDATHLHTSLAHVIHAAYQHCQRRLATSRATNDSNGLTTVDVKTDVANGISAFLIAVGLPVAETHVLKVDAAVGNCHDGVLGIDDVGFLIDHLYHTLAAGSTHGELHKYHRQHHQCRENCHHIGEQRRELTCGEFAANDIFCPKPRQGDDATIHYHHHHWMVQRHQALGAHKEAVERPCCLAEFLVLKVLAHKRLHHPDCRDILLDHIVQVVIFLEHLSEQFHGAAHNQVEHCAQDDKRYHKDKAHLGVDKHTHEDAENQV